MNVIASHLASLADYTRLREEAEGRARNLGLIHEVVQQVIGLTDPRGGGDHLRSSGALFRLRTCRGFYRG